MKEICKLLINSFSRSACIRASTRLKSTWVERQKRDTFVKQAKIDNWRCRSAFKLIELDDRHHVFKDGDVVVDCGAAPGSWTQVAVDRVNALRKREGPVGLVIGVDLQPITPVPGAIFLDSSDFTKQETIKNIQNVLSNQNCRIINVVISDMSPNASGVSAIDQQLSTELCLSALKFALTVLPNDGHFICKFLQNQDQKNLTNLMSKYFRDVSVFKPRASRTDSTEIYLLGRMRLKNK